MPTCEIDPDLQDQVRRFIGENGLTVNGAAVLLGVNRTTFWRFHETGKALAKTRNQVQKALANRKKSIAAHVSDDSVDSAARGHQVRPMLEEVLAERELKQIRRACEGVLALLNVYETQRSMTEKSKGAST